MFFSFLPRQVSSMGLIWAALQIPFKQAVRGFTGGSKIIVFL